MKVRTTAVFWIVALLAASGGAAGQAPPNLEERIRRVEEGLIPSNQSGRFAWDERKALAERMAHYSVPGVGIAVIEGFQVQWAKGYGVAEAGKGEPVTRQTLFHAASIGSGANVSLSFAGGDDLVTLSVHRCGP